MLEDENEDDCGCKRSSVDRWVTRRPGAFFICVRCVLCVVREIR